MAKKEKEGYSELLKDPRWQKRRLEILNRDGWTCQICGAKEKTLHVHHIWYDNDLKPWECRENCLITLCEDCQNDEHEIEDEIHHEIQQIRNIGVTKFEILQALYAVRFGLLKNPFYIYQLRDAGYGEEGLWDYVGILKVFAERRKRIKEEGMSK